MRGAGEEEKIVRHVSKESQLERKQPGSSHNGCLEEALSSEEGTEPHMALPLNTFLGAGCEEKTAMGRKTGRGVRREERDEVNRGTVEALTSVSYSALCGFCLRKGQQ